VTLQELGAEHAEQLTQINVWDFVQAATDVEGVVHNVFKVSGKVQESVIKV
jgi:hypothetical protein